MDSPISSKTHWSLSLGGEPPSPLGEVLENYLTALERGAPPDRDALLAAHPEIANELRDCLAKLDALHAATAGLQASPGRAVVAPLKSSLAPSQLGDYRILRELGRGGMGVVYEAEQLTLGRRVALKTLPLTGLLDERRIARFKNESIAAASLNHPHIVPIYGVGCDAGVHFYAMQCIEGASIADVISQRQALKKGATNDTQPNLPTSTITSAVGSSFHRLVAEVGRQSADALHYAHEQGVIHRDIKPSNLLIDATGQVWVTDFGLAATQTEVALTRTGELLGTLRYLSPEQASGDRPVDHRVDIYGLGVTLYELLSEKPAQMAEERGRLLRDVIDKQPPPLRRVDSSIPADLATVVSKAISKEPNDRYATAGDLAADLARFLSRQPVIARAPSAWRRATSWVRRNRAVAVLLSLVMCLLTAAALGALAHARQLETEQQRLQASLYARDIALAQQLIARGEHVRAEATLLKWMDTPDEQALRDFEWFYLWRQCRENASDVVLQHTADAYDVIFLKSCAKIATSSFSSSIAMWDAATFELLEQEAIRTKHKFEITKLSVNSSEEILASGGAGGFVCLWKIPGGTFIDKFSVGGLRIFDLAFSPDSQFLAASTYDENNDLSARKMTVTLWDLGQRQIVRKLDEFGQRPSAHFAPNGDLYVTSYSGDVEVWTRQRDPKHQDPGERWVKAQQRSLGLGPISVSALSADGRYLVTSSGGFQRLEENSTIQVWETAAWRLAQTYEPRVPGRFIDMRIDDNRWVLLGGEHGHLTLLDLQQESIVATRRVHHGPVFGVHFSEDGKFLCSASRDNTVRLWDRRRFVSRDRATMVERDSLCKVSGAIFAESPDHVCVAHTDGTILEWDTSARAVTRSINALSDDANTTAIDVSRDEKWLAVVRGQWPPSQLGQRVGQVEVHRRDDLGSNSRQWSAKLPDGAIITRPKFSPNSQLLAVPSLKKVRFYATGSGELIRELPLKWVKVASFSHDGHLFAAANGERTHIYRTSEWTVLRRIDTAEIATEALDFSPDSQFVATSDDRHCISLWHARDGGLVRKSEPLSDLVTVLFFSPNGRRIAAVSKDGLINLLDAESLEPQVTFPIPPAWTFHGAFSDDGNRLVVGSGKVSRIYDAGKIGALRGLNVKQLREIVCGPLAGQEIAD